MQFFGDRKQAAGGGSSSSRACEKVSFWEGVITFVSPTLATSVTAASYATKIYKRGANKTETILVIERLLLEIISDTHRTKNIFIICRPASQSQRPAL